MTALADTSGSDDRAARGATEVPWPGYGDILEAARTRSGRTESISLEVREVDGLPVVTLTSHFAFLGGSMGRRHGDVVVEAFDTAASLRAPVLLDVASGGARMQEGVVSLAQMARTTAALDRVRRAGSPVVARLRHPVTGGVYASYASAADVLVADAGATIGFAGPRVVEALVGEALDGSSHTAEAALEHGLVDAVLPPQDAADWALRTALLLHPHRRTVCDVGPVRTRPWTAHPPAEALRRARSQDRPGARRLLDAVADSWIELRGDRAGSDDRAALTAVAEIDDHRVVVIGIDRDAAGAGGLLGQPTAAGYRKLARVVRLADRWGLPIVSFVDTPGADPRPASDRDGLAVSIAECFMALHGVAVATLGVVVGEGGSGGAMALASTDGLVVQDDTVLEVIAPEGAAAIVFRDAGRAGEVLAWLRATPTDLQHLGYADAVLPGPTTVGADSATAALREHLHSWLAEPRTPTRPWWERSGPATKGGR